MDRERSLLVRNITTPLGFFVLSILIVEGILGVLATKAQGSNFTYLVIGMLGILALTILIVGGIAVLRPGVLQGAHPDAESLASDGHDAPMPTGLQSTRYKHEVFLSAPMAGATSESEYIDLREEASLVLSALKNACSFSDVYWAGDGIQTRADFDPPRIAVEEVCERIRGSTYFVLLYPKRIASSVLVETGLALAFGKTTVAFVRKQADLPFLLRSAASAFPSVKIYECADRGALLSTIAKQRRKLFGA